jgi:hypothetical protein
MLTRDAGPQLRSLRKSRDPASSWDEILPLYAELQIELADDLDELLGLGTPDKRPAAVSSAYLDLVERVYRAEPSASRRLQALAPELELLVEALEGPPSPHRHPRGDARGQRLRPRRARPASRLGRGQRFPSFCRASEHPPRHRLPTTTEAERERDAPPPVRLPGALDLLRAFS